MANRKISDLTALTATATGDLLPIVDISEAGAADQNKKITIENLFKGIPGNVGIGTSSPGVKLHVADGQIRVANSGALNPSLVFTGNGAGASGFQVGQRYNAQELFIYDLAALADRVVVDSSGNVGIGTSSPATVLDIATGGMIRLASTGGNNMIQVSTNSGANGLGMWAGGNPRFYATGGVIFAVNATIGTGTPTGYIDALRIDSSGQVSIGKTAPSENASSGSGYGFASPSVDPFFSVVNASATGNNACMYLNKRTTGSIAVFMTNNGSTDTSVGSISHNGTSTSFNTTSDYRLKENVTPVTDGITRLQQLNPSRFNFIVDPDRTVDGFIAHEIQDIVPEAITGEKDAEDDDGNPIYQGIDQSKLVPLLTAALQEAIAKIETLEARLTAAGIA